MSIELVISSHHLILCRPLLPLPSIFPSIRVFSNESVLCISSVQFSCSVLSDSSRPHGQHQDRHPCPSKLPESTQLISNELVMLSHHLILCCSLLLLTSIFPSLKAFSNVSAVHIKWPKYWSFNFSISSFSEYSGLISFRIDCLGLLAIQGTLKGLLQHYSLKASILWLSLFFMVQLSQPCMTTGKISFDYTDLCQ